LAGINAGREAQGKEPIILERSQAFIGVLIDDLISLGTKEPYRMFTSRSEFRLTLRAENSDFRLGPLAMQLGILNHEQEEVLKKKLDMKERGFKNLEEFKLKASDWEAAGVKIDAKTNNGWKSAEDILSSYSTTRIEDIQSVWQDKFQIEPQITKHIETECRYKIYLTKQIREIESLKRDQYRADISNIDFDVLKHAVCPEEIEKLKSNRPTTIHAASRIPGIRPTTLIYLHQYLRRVNPNLRQTSVIDDL